MFPFLFKVSSLERLGVMRNLIIDRGHSFNYSASAAYGDPQPTFPDLCAGTTVIRSTETYTPFASPGAEIEKSVITVTRDLVALAATVEYQIEGTSTCAPNCEDPWQQGDPWPSTPPEPPREHDLQGLAGLYIGLICGSVAFFLLLVCSCLCCYRVERRRKLQRQAELNAQAEAIRLEHVEERHDGAK